MGESDLTSYCLTLVAFWNLDVSLYDPLTLRVFMPIKSVPYGPCQFLMIAGHIGPQLQWPLCAFKAAL